MSGDNLLITGATGFVGRHLVSHLSSYGHRLTLAVRGADACPAAWHDNPHIRIVATGPIETAVNLDEALAGVTGVIHLAGLAHVRHSPEVADPFVPANAIATEKLTQATARHGIRMFIHMSSLATATANASSTVVDDTAWNAAPTAYGKSKQKAEKHVLALARSGVFAVSLRPPLVVGADARGNWRALQRLAATALPLPFAGASNRRSLIGIDTLVRAVAHLSTGRWSPDKSGNYCIADAETISLREIVSTLRRGMQRPQRLFHFPPAVLQGLARLIGRAQMADGLLGGLQVDAGRFRRTFDFSQHQSLSASILESASGFRNSMLRGRDQ